MTWRYKVCNNNLLAFLTEAVNATNPLLNPHWVPRNVVVHECVAELIVQTLAANLGRQQNVESVRVVTTMAKALTQVLSFNVRNSTGDDSNSDT